MKFFLCLLALAVSANASFLKGGLVGLVGAPAVYGGSYAPAYAGYADTKVVNVVQETVPVVRSVVPVVQRVAPVVQHVAPVVQHVAPIVQHVAPVNVVRVAHVPTYAYRAYSAPAVYKTVSVHAAPSYGGWYKK